MEKHIEIDMEKCTGCKLCELACSAVKTGRFSPTDSRIQIVLEQVPEIPVPVLLDNCDYCFGNPVCVRFCLPQAIVWKDMESKPERIRLEDTARIAQEWFDANCR